MIRIKRYITSIPLYIQHITMSSSSSDEEGYSNYKKNEKDDKDLANLLDKTLNIEKILKSNDLDGIVHYIETFKPKNIVVLVGAGASVSAGIPDFRSPKTGLYDNLAKYSLPYPEAIFEMSFFKKKPEPFYMLAKELWPTNFEPTSVHYFIRLLHEKELLLRCFTQNIDSLEHLAGLPKEKIVAAHGNFDSATIITGKNSGKKVDVDLVEKHLREDSIEELNKKFGGLIKPDIVFFGERLPERFFSLSKEDFDKCDLCIVIGTSLKVHPFASLIEEPKSHVPRLLINLEEVGEFSFDFNDKKIRDAKFLGFADDGVTELCSKLDWKLEEYIKKIKKTNKL